MKRIVILGSGSVAYALAHALTEKGHPPVQIFARNEHEARGIAFSCGCPHASEPDALAAADLYIMAVSDKAVRSMASALNFGDAVVAHTAGSLPLDSFPESVKHAGVFYPLQTFSPHRRLEFDHVPVLIEGSDQKALDELREAAGLLSKHVLEADTERRARLHIAAVFASNFTNYMYTVAEKLAAEAGFEYEVLKPLIEETARKAVDADSPVETQTGPAIRNDFQTKSLHCEMLQEKPDLKNIYINLSNSIWETSKKTSQK